MAEWSIAAVLKTVELRGSWGSNPYLSADILENQGVTRQTPDFTPKNVKLGVLFLDMWKAGSRKSVAIQLHHAHKVDLLLTIK